MSNQIVPQANLNAAFGTGLAMLAPLLSALKADDVDRLAMLQLEKLGSLFHVNGQYARKTPELLRRCSSVCLDRIDVEVGWRKGDTASFLAQSAGGQAMALMCFCLINTCKETDIGLILDGLSQRLLPKSLPKSNPRQLTHLANLLAAKMQTIGFGNILAKAVLQIQTVDKPLSKKLPPNFFDYMTSEAAIEFYHALSGLLFNGRYMRRVFGLHAMGHIMTILLIMIPDNVKVTTDTLTIQQGHAPSILLHINSDQTNTIIQGADRLNNPQLITRTLLLRHERRSSPYHFDWAGHVTDALRIALAGIGVELTDAIIVACCDLLVALSQTILFTETTSESETSLPLNGLSDLLGSEKAQRCHDICLIVFGATPSTYDCNFRLAYLNLVERVKAAAGPECHCTCVSIESCDLNPFVKRAVQDCLHHTMWRFVMSAVNRACSALLISAGPYTTTIFDIASLHEDDLILPWSGPLLSTPRPTSAFNNCAQVHSWVMSMGRGHRSYDTVLADRHGSNTIYCVSLKNLKIDPHGGLRYRLADGQLHFKEHTYNRLTSARVTSRRTAARPLTESKGQIRPSCLGGHLHVISLIKETKPELELELRTTMLAQDHVIQLDLSRVMWSSIGLNDAPECSHNPTADLSPELHDDVWTTCVVAPKAPLDKIAIVQTKDNETSQLLACEPGSGLLLQRRCCLDCAVAYAKEKGLSQIVVAC